jgi:hypothetical protein
VQKLTIVAAAALLLSGGAVAMAKSHKSVAKPRPGVAMTTEPYLSPEAAHLRQMQKYWPGVPLCDEGGYRIRPCDMGTTGGGRP